MSLDMAEKIKPHFWIPILIIAGIYASLSIWAHRIDAARTDCQEAVIASHKIASSDDFNNYLSDMQQCAISHPSHPWAEFRG